MKKIITTVGTSLFTNFMQDEVKKKYGRDYASVSIESAYNAIEDAKAGAADIWSDRYKHDVRTIQENIEDFWFDDGFKNNKVASAEIASLLKISEQEQEKVQVHLIATDTLLSVLAAELIAIWFERHKYLAPNIDEVLFKRVQNDFREQSESDFVIKSLKIDKQEDYEEGFMNLIEVLNRVKTKYSFVNITGGYKGIVPLVTIWGQINNVDIGYLFKEKGINDETDFLILKSLPIQFDWEFLEVISYAINRDVRINLKETEDHDKKILKLLTENQLVDQNRELTALGIAVEAYLKKDGQPLANNILGLFIEYKLFEFFSTETFKGRNYNPEKIAIYKKEDGALTREETQTGYCEIDLFLKEEDEQFIIAEVKAYNQVGAKTISELTEKVRKYKEFTESLDPRKRDKILFYPEPKELWIIVVSPSFNVSIGEWFENPKDSKLQELKKARKLLGDKFKAISYQMNLSSGKLSKGIVAINTKKLLQASIKPEDLIEVNLV